jgi:hypothetical protein
MKSLYKFLTLLLCCLVVTTGTAAVDRDLGRPQLATPDSLSTFDLGDVLNALPTIPVAVPMTVTTSNPITEIVNTIEWTDAHLDFNGIELGPGVDTTVVSVTILSETDSVVQYTINAGGSVFSIGTDPVALLHFTPTCSLGYGASTGVDFTDGANDNIYVSGGLSYSPLLDGGSITTEPEGVSHLWANTVPAYVGEQTIEWKARFYQYTPAELSLVAIEYDPTEVRFDSVTALDGLAGGSVNVDMHIYGTVVLGINAGVLPADVTLELFAAHFGMVDDRDNTSVYVAFIGANRINLCGEDNQPEYMTGGSITIDNHTASADIWQIDKYASATYYDVPFRMDSNHPINAYEFWLDFPAEDITFDGVIAEAGYAAPSAWVDAGDTTKINVNNGFGTNYLPGDLPDTVFKLRFSPRSTPSVGEQFDITFVDPHPENGIWYAMELGGLHPAEITGLSNGYIRIVSPPPPHPAARRCTGGTVASSRSKTTSWRNATASGSNRA